MFLISCFVFSFVLIQDIRCAFSDECHAIYDLENEIDRLFDFALEDGSTVHPSCLQYCFSNIDSLINDIFMRDQMKSIIDSLLPDYEEVIFDDVSDRCPRTGLDDACRFWYKQISCARPTKQPEKLSPPIIPTGFGDRAGTTRIFSNGEREMKVKTHDVNSEPYQKWMQAIFGLLERSIPRKSKSQSSVTNSSGNVIIKVIHGWVFDSEASEENNSSPKSFSDGQAASSTNDQQCFSNYLSNYVRLHVRSGRQPSGGVTSNGNSLAGKSNYSENKNGNQPGMAVADSSPVNSNYPRSDAASSKSSPFGSMKSIGDAINDINAAVLLGNSRFFDANGNGIRYADGQNVTNAKSNGAKPDVEPTSSANVPEKTWTRQSQSKGPTNLFGESTVNPLDINCTVQGFSPRCVDRQGTSAADRQQKSEFANKPNQPPNVPRVYYSRKLPFAPKTAPATTAAPRSKFAAFSNSPQLFGIPRKSPFLDEQTIKKVFQINQKV